LTKLIIDKWNLSTNDYSVSLSSFYFNIQISKVSKISKTVKDDIKICEEKDVEVLGDNKLLNDNILINNSQINNDIGKDIQTNQLDTINQTKSLVLNKTDSNIELIISPNNSPDSLQRPNKQKLSKKLKDEYKLVTSSTELEEDNADNDEQIHEDPHNHRDPHNHTHHLDNTRNDGLTPFHTKIEEIFNVPFLLSFKNSTFNTLDNFFSAKDKDAKQLFTEISSKYQKINIDCKCFNSLVIGLIFIIFIGYASFVCGLLFVFDMLINILCIVIGVMIMSISLLKLMKYFEYFNGNVKKDMKVYINELNSKNKKKKLFAFPKLNGNFVTIIKFNYVPNLSYENDESLDISKYY